MVNNIRLYLLSVLLVLTFVMVNNTAYSRGATYAFIRGRVYNDSGGIEANLTQYGWVEDPTAFSAMPHPVYTARRNREDYIVLGNIAVAAPNTTGGSPRVFVLIRKEGPIYSPSWGRFVRDIFYGIANVNSPRDIMFQTYVGRQSYNRNSDATRFHLTGSIVWPAADIAVNPQGSRYYMYISNAVNPNYSPQPSGSVPYIGPVIYCNGVIFDTASSDVKSITVATRDMHNEWIYTTDLVDITVPETWKRTWGRDAHSVYRLEPDGAVHNNFHLSTDLYGGTASMAAPRGIVQAAARQPSLASSAATLVNPDNDAFTELGRQGSVTLDYGIDLTQSRSVVIREHSLGVTDSYELPVQNGRLVQDTVHTPEGEELHVSLVDSTGDGIKNALKIEDKSQEIMRRVNVQKSGIAENWRFQREIENDPSRSIISQEWSSFPTTRNYVVQEPDPAMRASATGKADFVNIQRVWIDQPLPTPSGYDITAISADGEGFLYTLRRWLSSNYQRTSTWTNADGTFTYETYERKTFYRLAMHSHLYLNYGQQTLIPKVEGQSLRYYKLKYRAHMGGLSESDYYYLYDYANMWAPYDEVSLGSVNLALPPTAVGQAHADIEMYPATNVRATRSIDGRHRGELIVDVHEGTLLSRAIAPRNDVVFEGYQSFETFNSSIEWTEFPAYLGYWDTYLDDTNLPYIYIPNRYYTIADAEAHLNFDYDGDAAFDTPPIGGGFPSNTVIGRHYKRAMLLDTWFYPGSSSTQPASFYYADRYGTRARDSRHYVWSLRRLALKYDRATGYTTPISSDGTYQGHEDDWPDDWAEAGALTPWIVMNMGGRDYVVEGPQGSFWDHDRDPLTADSMLFYPGRDRAGVNGFRFQPGNFKFEDGGIYQLRVLARYRTINWQRMTQAIQGGASLFWWDEPWYIEPGYSEWYSNFNYEDFLVGDDYIAPGGVPPDTGFPFFEMTDTAEVVVTAYNPEDRPKYLAVEIVDISTDYMDERVQENKELAMYSGLRVNPGPVVSDGKYTAPNGVPEFKMAEINEDVKWQWFAKLWMLDPVSGQKIAYDQLKLVPPKRLQEEIWGELGGIFDMEDTADGEAATGGVIDVDRTEVDQYTDVMEPDIDEVYNPELHELTGPEWEEWDGEHPGGGGHWSDSNALLSDKYSGLIPFRSDGANWTITWTVQTMRYDPAPSFNEEMPNESDVWGVMPNEGGAEINYYEGPEITKTAKLIPTRMPLRHAHGHLNYQPWYAQMAEAHTRTLDVDEMFVDSSGDTFDIMDFLRRPEDYPQADLSIDGRMRDENEEEEHIPPLLSTPTESAGTGFASDFFTRFDTPIIPLRYRITATVEYHVMEYVEDGGLLADGDEYSGPIEDDQTRMGDAERRQRIGYDGVEETRFARAAVDVFVKDRTLPRVFFERPNYSHGTTGDMYPSNNQEIRVIVVDNNPFDGIVATDTSGMGDHEFDVGEGYQGSQVHILYPMQMAPKLRPIHVARESAALDPALAGPMDFVSWYYPRYIWGRPFGRDLDGAEGGGFAMSDPIIANPFHTENGYTIPGLRQSVMMFTLPAESILLPAMDYGNLGVEGDATNVEFIDGEARIGAEFSSRTSTALHVYAVAESGAHNWFHNPELRPMYGFSYDNEAGRISGGHLDVDGHGHYNGHDHVRVILNSNSDYWSHDLGDGFEPVPGQPLGSLPSHAPGVPMTAGGDITLDTSASEAVEKSVPLPHPPSCRPLMDETGADLHNQATEGMPGWAMYEHFQTADELVDLPMPTRPVVDDIMSGSGGIEGKFGIAATAISVEDNDPPNVWVKITNPKRGITIGYYLFDQHFVDDQTDNSSNYAALFERPFSDRVVWNGASMSLSPNDRGPLMAIVTGNYPNNDPTLYNDPVLEFRNPAIVSEMLRESSAWSMDHVDPSQPRDRGLSTHSLPWLPPGVVDPGNVANMGLNFPAYGYNPPFDYQSSIFDFGTEGDLNMPTLWVDEDQQILIEIFAWDNVAQGDLRLKAFGTRDANNMIHFWPCNGDGCAGDCAGDYHGALHITNNNSPGGDSVTPEHEDTTAGFRWTHPDHSPASSLSGMLNRLGHNSGPDLDRVNDVNRWPDNFRYAYARTMVRFRNSTRADEDDEVLTVRVRDWNHNERILSIPFRIGDTTMLIDTRHERKYRGKIQDF